MFSFYNNLDDLKMKDLKLKENYKYTIVHPFMAYNEETNIEEMEKIEVTLELCTVYKGVPYGLAIINYSDPDDITFSFKGICVFNQGKLSNSSFICIKGDGTGFTFTKMENGRPVDNSYFTLFCPKRYKQNVFSLNKAIDVSGC
jgi:hypothetical protein